MVRRDGANDCAKNFSSRLAISAVAYPGILSKPFVEQIAVCAICAAEKYRTGRETLRCNKSPSENCLICFWTSNHRPSHKALLYSQWLSHNDLVQTQNVGVVT